MSNFLVDLQERIADYPPWLVALAGGAVLALLLIILAKAFRVAAVILFLAALAIGGWLAFRAFVDPGPARDGVSADHPAVFPAVAMASIAVASPLSCQGFPARCNSRQ